MARTPQYLDVAANLRLAITQGQYEVGSRLPTEHELCDEYSVSRHTVRSALKLLEEEGLIERRPGRGTKIISIGTPATFIQTLGGLNDLLQYAHEASLKIISSKEEFISTSTAQRINAPKETKWLCLNGLRIVGNVPVAATSVYISAQLGANERQFRKAKEAVTEIIEKKFGISVSLIDQTIRAELLDKEDAKALGIKTGTPILRTIRRYYDASERLFLVSDSRHPAERFAYEMTYKRSR